MLLDSTYGFWMFVVVWPLIAVAVVAFGWVDDVAAGRRARGYPDEGVGGGSAAGRCERRQSASVPFFLPPERVVPPSGVEGHP